MEVALLLAFVGKLRRHFLLLVVGMVLVLFLSPFVSPLGDEGVCARTLTLRHPFMFIVFPLHPPLRKQEFLLHSCMGCL